MKSIFVILSLIALYDPFMNEKVCAAVYTDRVVAVVNNDVILNSEIKKHGQPFMRSIMNLPLGVVPPGKWPTEREILDELIVIRLLEQEAARKGISLDEKAVDASIESIRKRNNLTQDQFVLFLAANDLTLPEYKKIMTRQFKLTRLIENEVAKKVPMSEEDAQKYFLANREKIDDQYTKLLENLTPARPPGDQAQPEIPTHEEILVGGKIRLRQITLKIPAKGKKQDVQKVMERAKLIFQDAMAGGDFAKLAQKYSQDPNAKSGGDLGFMDYKDLVPGLQNMVQRMKPGDVTPPLRTKDAVILFSLADAQGRQIKKVPIPEKVRKEMEKKWQEAYQRKGDRGGERGDTVPGEELEARKESMKKEETPGNGASQKKPSILSPEEEKEYGKVKNKVTAIVRHEKIQSRMKEWIEGLRKNSIIDVKL